MTIRLGLSLIALAATASGACAQAEAPRPGTPGTVSMDLGTFQARSRASVLRADADRDGRVSREEWAAWTTAHPGRKPVDRDRQFRSLDRNGDGLVSGDELDARSSARFGRLDADRDGIVTRTRRQPAASR